MAAAGRKLFSQYRLRGCHRGGQVVRPARWKAFTASPVRVAAGEKSVALADERYIRDSILLPKREVVAGYEPVMPSFRGPDQRGQTCSRSSHISNRSGRRRASG